MYEQMDVKKRDIVEKIRRTEYKLQWNTLLQLYLQGKALPQERDKLLDMALIELNKAAIIIKNQTDYLKQIQC